MSLENIIFEGPVDDEDRKIYPEYFTVEVDQYVAGLPKNLDEKARKKIKQEMETEPSFIDKQALQVHARYQGYKSGKLRKSPKEIGRIVSYFAKKQVDELHEMPVELAEDYYGKFIEGMAVAKNMSFMDAVVFVRDYCEDYVPKKLIGIIERSYQMLEKKEEKKKAPQKLNKSKAKPSVRPNPATNLVFDSSVSQDDVELFSKYWNIACEEAYTLFDQMLLGGKSVTYIEGIEREFLKRPALTEKNLACIPAYVGYKAGTIGADHNAVGKICAEFVKIQAEHIKLGKNSSDMLAQFIYGYSKSAHMAAEKAKEYVESCALGYADRKLLKIIHDARKNRKYDII